jgi:outer membrane protein assembly factor BamA
MRFLTKKLLVLTALAAPAFAGTETIEPSQGDTTAAVSSQADDFQRFSAVPILGYTEETKYQFGAMAIIFFRPEFEGGNATELDLSFYGTTRKQVTGSISPKFFFLKDQISGDLDLHYENWVGNYFGRGNNPDIDDFRKFDRHTFYLTSLIEMNFGTKQWLQDFRYGLFFEINHTYIDFNRYHYYGSIEHPQNTDGWRNGIGYHLSLDTRDNTNWARHGYLVQWGHYFYNKALGDYSYTQQEFDIRGYTEFIWNTSMAVGLLWQRINGNAPFDKLAGSDGLKRFRGVEKNYFYGNQAMFLQMEFRKKLFWRLAGDIFFEGGKTGDYFSDLMRNKWHRSLGFGGRLALNQKENLYARCELSWVDFKSVGMTMYVRDAF